MPDAPTLAQVIAKHRVIRHTTRKVQCRCGADFDSRQQHDAHLAAAVHEAGCLWVPGLRAEQLRLILGDPGYDHSGEYRAALMRLAQEQGRDEK